MCDAQEHEGAQGAVEEFFITWYTRLAVLADIRYPEDAYQEGRFGPKHLRLNTLEWSFILTAALQRMLEQGKDISHEHSPIRGRY